MNDTTTELQVSPISKIIEESGLSEVKGLVLKTKFDDFFTMADGWKKDADALVIIDVTQVADMKKAEEARKMLKKYRCDVETTRKELKDASLKEGRAIDEIAGKITALIEPIEKDLETKAKFKEIFEANRKATLKAERLEKLIPYSVAMNADMLGEMDESMFDNLLSGYKKSHEEKIEVDAKAERERLEAIEAENKRQAEIKAENERLKKEAEEKEKALAVERAKVEKERQEAEVKAKKEREEIEAKVKIERDKVEAENKRIQAEQNAKLEKERAERKKLADELKAKQDAEAKAKKDTEAAAKKAANAPEKAKLLALAKRVLGLELPIMVTEEGKAVLAEIKAKNISYSNWIITQANTL